MERKKQNNWRKHGEGGATHQPSGNGGGGDDGPSLSRGPSFAIYSDKTRTEKKVKPPLSLREFLRLFVKQKREDRIAVQTMTSRVEEAANSVSRLSEEVGLLGSCRWGQQSDASTPNVVKYLDATCPPAVSCIARSYRAGTGDQLRGTGQAKKSVPNEAISGSIQFSPKHNLCPAILICAYRS